MNLLNKQVLGENCKGNDKLYEIKEKSVHFSSQEGYVSRVID